MQDTNGRDHTSADHIQSNIDPEQQRCLSRTRLKVAVLNKQRRRVENHVLCVGPETVVCCSCVLALLPHHSQPHRPLQDAQGRGHPKYSLDTKQDLTPPE